MKTTSDYVITLSTMGDYYLTRNGTVVGYFPTTGGLQSVTSRVKYHFGVPMLHAPLYVQDTLKAFGLARIVP